MMQVVIETRDGWMIRCHSPKCQWHEFPKRATHSGQSWSFNGDMQRPTFSPSMNESRNPAGPHHNPDVESGRCHFIVTDGVINYCGDCTHELRGPHPMLPFDAEKVEYYRMLKDGGWP